MKISYLKTSLSLKNNSNACTSSAIPFNFDIFDPISFLKSKRIIRLQTLFKEKILNKVSIAATYDNSLQEVNLEDYTNTDISCKNYLPYYDKIVIFKNKISIKLNSLEVTISIELHSSILIDDFYYVKCSFDALEGESNTSLKNYFNNDFRKGLGKFVNDDALSQFYQIINTALNDINISSQNGHFYKSGGYTIIEKELVNILTRIKRFDELLAGFVGERLFINKII